MKSKPWRTDVMLVREILASVDVIRDPYVKSVTYARIGERLARAGDVNHRTAFLKALDTAREIEDPVKMFRALLSVGHSLGRAGFRTYRKVFQTVLEDSRLLPPPGRDEVMRTAVSYLLALGETGEAVTYALEIADSKVRNEVLLQIVRASARTMDGDQLKAAYRLRKGKLALEYIEGEPYLSRALLELTKAYISLGAYEKAISLLRAMGSREWTRQAFKEVSFRLKEKGVLGHYIDLLESIAGELIEKFGREFTEELALAFALAGEGKSAVELIRKLENGDDLLVSTALELLGRDPEVLPDFISVLNEGEAELVGKAVMNRLLERPELARKDVVEAVEKSTPSEEVLAKVSRYYVLTGRIDDALRVGSRIEDPELRSVVMADVSHHLLKTGDIERAIDTALEVRDPRFSSILVSEILIKALERELPGRVRQWSGSKH
ncbi:prenyltransferase [Thermococcus sp.]|uniref:prenyltransferase n=1 Tax=Thermococcus sp. TaxID=35749 RepID=UPI002608FD90|nr:prenyltransferase [Thermococcus sp.]